MMIRTALKTMPLLVLGLAACTNRSGTAYVEIWNDQTATTQRAEPIQVDPRVDVVQNEYRRSHLNDGSNIKQRIIIRGPVLIVPAPATQPAIAPPPHYEPLRP